MYWHEPAPSVVDLDSHEEHLWLVAGLGFVVGDMLTTSIGLGFVGVAEMHPIGARLFQYSIVGTMVALKIAVFGGCYLLWKHTPRPHCVGVPLGLAIFGILITFWNLYIIALVLLF